MKSEVDVEESIAATSDRVFQTDKESPKLEPTVQPRTVADDDIPNLREQGSHTGSDKDISSNQDSNVFDRPFTESATAWDSTIDDGFLTDEESPNFEHMVQPRTVADNVNRTVRNRNNTRGRWSGPGSENDISSDENYNLFSQPVTESATARAVIETNSFSVEHVKCCEIPVTELVTIRVSDTEEPLVMRVSTITTELSTRNKCV